MVWNSAMFSFGRAGVAGLFLCALAAAPISAQEADAPRRQLSGSVFADRAILVTGYGRWDDRDNPPLRTAQPLVDPSQWFGANSALAKAHLADPLAAKYAIFALDITAEGMIAQCRYAENSPVVVDEAALCADIAGQGFLPQLANDGSRESGRFHLMLRTREFVTEADAPPRPMFTSERDPRPLPVQAPRADRIENFPPADFQMSSLYRPPAWQTAPNPGWGDFARDEAKTGLILHRSARGLACRVLEPSGDAQRDAAACRYGQEQLAPDWSALEGDRGWMVPLYILHRAQGMVAIGPDPERTRETTMPAGVEAALVDALTRAGVLPDGRAASRLGLRLSSAPTGEVTHCRVVTTTGKDTTDIAACRIAREVVRMEPQEDVFGTPRDSAGMFWWAGSRPD